MKYFAILLFLLSITSSFGQTKIQFKLDGGKGFFAAYPPPEDPKGILIILPHYLQSEEDFIRQHNIMQQAYTQGIVTVVVNVGRKLFANSSVVELLNEVCEKTIEGFDVPRDKVIFGGYGYGGTIMLKYAQLCLKYTKDFPLTPAAVYTVNSHVDIALAFNSYERQIARSTDLELVQEARNFREIILRTLEGTPQQDPFVYQSVSPFVYESNSVNHIEMLSDTPIRMYHDTDLVWNMKNRNTSAYDMPATAASEFIYQLRKLGNKQAELIALENEGSNANRKLVVNEKNLNIWMTEKLGIE